MFSNFAPQRREAGWGRRGLEDPTGFMPVVNAFDDIEAAGGRRGPEDPTGFMPVVNEFDDIEPAGAAVDRMTPPVLCRW